MEGKKITTSILPLAIDWERLRDGGARSKEQEEESRAGLEYLVLKKLQEEGEKKTSPYIAKAMGPTT